MATINCDKCGKPCNPNGTIDTGYGVTHNRDGSKSRHCYTCCADADRQWMIDTGVITLYLSNGKVSNWPGSLSFPAACTWTTDHNWRGVKQTYVRFRGPDGAVWTGRQVGKWSDLVTCKRTKLATCNA